jgi:hypothetical protein
MENSICLDITPKSGLNKCQFPFENYYVLQNVTENKALFNLKNEEDGSWIFRFDYITQKYYLTIKSNNQEYINHHVSYYCKRTDEVIIQTSNTERVVYLSLDNYLTKMTDIYNFNLIKQVLVF